MTDERQKKGISRRTVVKGAAWAVPAVPLVVATPAYAASPSCITVSLSGDACKYPGAGSEWSYKLIFCFANSCGGTYNIWISRITNNAGKPFTTCGDCSLPLDGQTPIQIGPTKPGEPYCLPACYFSSESSANSIEIWGSFDGPVPPNAEVMLMSTPAPTKPCVGTSPCVTTAAKH